MGEFGACLVLVGCFVLSVKLMLFDCLEFHRDLKLVAPSRFQQQLHLVLFCRLEDTYRCESIRTSFGVLSVFGTKSNTVGVHFYEEYNNQWFSATLVCMIAIIGIPCEKL